MIKHVNDQISKGDTDRQVEALQQALLKEKQLRMKLEHRIQFLDVFIRGSIHGIRNASINALAYSDLIKSYPEGEKRDRSLRIIKESALEIKELLAQISEFRYIELSDITPEQCNIQKELDSVLGEINSLFPEKQIVAHIDLSGSVEMTVAKIHLKTLFKALIQNAVQYTPDTDLIPVHIFIKKTAGYFTMTISDQGIGMDLEESKDKPFMPFKKLSTLSDGPGLGLSLVKSIVEHYSGKIQINSTLGKGTTITTLLQIPD